MARSRRFIAYFFPIMSNIYRECKLMLGGKRGRSGCSRKCFGQGLQTQSGTTNCTLSDKNLSQSPTLALTGNSGNSVGLGTSGDKNKIDGLRRTLEVMWWWSVHVFSLFRKEWYPGPDSNRYSISTEGFSYQLQLSLPLINIYI